MTLKREVIEYERWVDDSSPGMVGRIEGSHVVVEYETSNGEVATVSVDADAAHAVAAFIVALADEPGMLNSEPVEPVTETNTEGAPTNG